MPLRLYRFLRTVTRRTLDATPIGSTNVIGHVRRSVRNRLLSADPSDGSFLVTVDRVTLRLPDAFMPHYVDRDYEPITRAWLAGELKAGMTAIDVGAHIGFFTLLMSRLVGREGHIYGFEPAEENLHYLDENVALNHAPNVTIIGAAVGARKERRTFNLTGSSDSHGFYSHPLTRTMRTVEIEQVALDDEAPARVDLVKIDVEGAELEVLDGMRNTLAANPGIRILVEWNPACMRSAGYEPDALPRRLEELGFTMVVLDDRAGEVRNLDAVRRELAADPVPPSWYVNLAGRREDRR